jgi:hypothetical protein
MKILKITGLVFFSFIIIVKFYLTCFKNVPLDKTSVLVLICLIFITLFRTKVSWFLGIGIALFGIYTLTFISIKVAEPTAMEFTSSLSYLIFGTHTGSSLRSLIDIVPDFFYVLTILFLLSKRGRLEYQKGSRNILGEAAKFFGFNSDSMSKKVEK